MPAMTDTEPQFTMVGDRRIALRRRAGHEPGFVWLGGYRSDMKGTKAAALDAWAQRTGRAFVRFDYSGHGESGGDFAQGTISRWLEESLAVFRAFTTGRQILVGSSMGGWIALRMVQELHRAGEGDRLAGLLLTAPAPDFTTELVEPPSRPARRRPGPLPADDVTLSLVRAGAHRLSRPQDIAMMIRAAEGLVELAG